MARAGAREKDVIGDLRANAKEVAPNAPTPVLAGDPKDPGGSMMRPPGLPENCPVVALGYKGDLYFFMTADHGFKVIRDEKFSKNKMVSLYCGRLDYIEYTWPRYGKNGAVTGFDGDACYADHMAEAHKAGPWDPANRMREGGGWREPDGTFVLHCGTVLFTKKLSGGEAERTPGRYGDFVYAKGEAQPQPWADKVTGKAMAKLLDGFKTFTWARPELDPQFLLGWLVCGLLGGALKWRPLVWITGDKGTGKSTLQEMIEHVLGGALVHASDASAAGIYQALKFSSKPVTLDEMEAGEDNRRAQTVIQLARQASSGGLVLRGGQDHAGVEFTARSCFLFSSINIPPLLSQDLSRMAILDLKPWEGRAHGLNPEKLEELGRKLRKRLLDHWPKWEERLALWREGLKRHGHSDRNADQFGTLLAAADLALNDDMPHSDTIDEHIAAWKLDRLAEQADDMSDSQRMIDHVLTKPLDIMRSGSKVNAARLLELALGGVVNEAQSDEQQRADAERDLMSIGLKVIREHSLVWLAVANNHQGLARVFEGSHWAGRSGTVGVWVQAARRVPGARWDNDRVRFNGAQVRVTLVPMDRVLPPEAAPLVDDAA